MAGYSYLLQHKAGKDRSNADACSQLPLRGSTLDLDQQPEIVRVLRRLEESPVQSKQSRAWIRRGPGFFTHLQLRGTRMATGHTDGGI